MRRNPDFWLAIGLLAFSVYAGILTSELSDVGTGTWAGPSFFPWLMVGSIALLSLGLLGRSLWRAGGRSEGGGKAGGSLLLKLGLFFVLMLAYAVLYVPAGYLISTISFFVIAMLVLGERRFAHLAVIPVGLVLSVYLVFTQVIKVYLP